MITLDDDRFIIEETIIPENAESRQFVSVSSKLSWNLEKFPGHKLDHKELKFTVSCLVEETDIGSEISSSSRIEVECKQLFFFLKFVIAFNYKK